MIVLNKWMFSAVVTTSMAVIASSALGVYLNIKKHAHEVVSADNRKANNASGVRTPSQTHLASPLIKDASPESVSKNNAANGNSTSAPAAFSYLAGGEEDNGSTADSSFHFVPELMAKNYAGNDTTHNSRATRSSSTSVSEVPEPATYALLAGGLAMIFFISRRRKRD